MYNHNNKEVHICGSHGFLEIHLAGEFRSSPAPTHLSIIIKSSWRTLQEGRSVVIGLGTRLWSHQLYP